MAQTQNEHLTTGQISASFDKQLSPQEQAVFDAHISSCQQCQNTLSDLKLTTALLHSLPVEEVPRSFVLPDNVSILPDRTIRQDAPVTALPQRQRPQRSVLRRSVRIISTLAAVLALCFIISGMLPLIYSGAGNSASSTTSGSTMAPVDHGAATPGVNQPNNAVPQRDRLQQLHPRRQPIRSLRIAKLRYLRVLIIQQFKVKALPSHPSSTSVNHWYDLAQVS